MKVMTLQPYSVPSQLVSLSICQLCHSG